MEFYVYALLDTRKPGVFDYGKYSFAYEPFYIGKGKGQRVSAHFWPQNLENKSHKSNRINKIHSSGLDVYYQFVRENITEEIAFKLERRLIELIGRSMFDKGPLTNKTEGGEGASGRIVGNKERRRRSLIQRIVRSKETAEQLAVRSSKISLTRKTINNTYGTCTFPGCLESIARTSRLCLKHGAQLDRTGKTGKTKYDPNKIVIKKNHAEIILCNRNNEEVGRCLIDLDKVDLIEDTKWCLNVNSAFHCKAGYIQKTLFGVKSILQLKYLNGNKLDCRKNNVTY